MIEGTNKNGNNKLNNNFETHSTQSSLQSHKLPSTLQKIDSDDYLLRNENDALNDVITEGKDFQNNINNNNNTDLMDQSSFNDELSIDSNIISSHEHLDNISGSTQSYRPNDLNSKSNTNSTHEDDNNNNNPIDQSLTIKRTKTRLWSPKMKLKRRKIIKHFIQINIIYAFFCFIVLVFAWGTVYNTSSHYNKINFLTVIQDDIPTENNNIIPVTNVIPTIIDQIPGNWHIYNESAFKSKYNLKTTQEINSKIIKLIYDEKYWVALNVKPNITNAMVDSLILENNQTAFNATNFFQIVYESGRDPAHVLTYMVPLVTEVETNFNQYCIEIYTPSLIQNITNNNSNNVTINWSNLAAMMNMQFETIDYRPFYDRILLLSSQIGDVFAILLTIFQFLIYGALHGQVAPLLRQRSRIYYRIIISMLTHFFASLFWCTVSAMFQIDFTLKFGRAGFIIYWMSTWMYMWACGSANENVISILFTVYPQYLGFWILGFVLCNLVTGFFPMVLNNNFYRIGYMFPMRNMVDINRTIFFGLSSSPQKFGRCYGVFTAWIVVSTTLLPFVMKWSKKLAIWKGKRIQRELEREEERQQKLIETLHNKEKIDT